MTAADRLIVALDGDAPTMGEVFIRLHRETPIRWFKIGPQMLLQHSGMILIENMMREGEVNLFLDLKLYDTRDTVQNTVKAAFGIGARFITVHATPSVMEAAMRAKPADLRCKVLAVGPLSDQLIGKFSSWIEDAYIGGLGDGVIIPSSYLMPYARWVHRQNKLVVSPGIRQAYSVDIPGSSGVPFRQLPDNHVSPITPTEALRAGADYLVVGRPITATPDPVASARAIIEEMEAAV